jgi:hypothetical protein
VEEIWEAARLPAETEVAEAAAARAQARMPGPERVKAAALTTERGKRGETAERADTAVAPFETAVGEEIVTAATYCWGTAVAAAAQEVAEAKAKEAEAAEAERRAEAEATARAAAALAVRAEARQVQVRAEVQATENAKGVEARGKGAAAMLTSEDEAVTEVALEAAVRAAHELEEAARLEALDAAQVEVARPKAEESAAMMAAVKAAVDLEEVATLKASNEKEAAGAAMLEASKALDKELGARALGATALAEVPRGVPEAVTRSAAHVRKVGHGP